MATGTKQHVVTLISQDQLFKGTWTGGNGAGSTGFTLTQMPIALQGDSSTLGSNNLPTSLGQITDMAIDTANQVLYFDTNVISTDGTHNSSSSIFSYSLSGANSNVGGAGAFNTVWTQTAAVPGALLDLVIDPQTQKYYVSVTDGTTVGKNDIYDGSLIGGAAPSKFITVNTSSGDPGLTPLGLAVDNTPTVATSASTVVYNVGGSAVTVDHPGAGIGITDSSGTVASATVTVTNFQTGDVLGIPTADLTNGNHIVGTNITESYNTANGVLTLSGTDSLADYQTAMSEVTFSSTAANPSSTPRTITFAAKDGFGGGSSATDTVDVHNIPLVTAGATASFTGGGNPVLLDPTLNVTDSSSTTMASATISITSGFITGDTLNFANTNSTTEGNITGSYSNGVLTLTSAADTATVTQWKNALEAVTYSFSPSGGDPTGGAANDTSRTITWVVNDGASSSSPVTSTVTVAHVAPTVTIGTGGNVTFTGGSTTPVVLDNTLGVADLDSSGALASATVTIGGFAAGDTLNFTNTGAASEGNIAISSNSGGKLVLISSDHSATLAQWATALDSITYSFSPAKGDPTAGGTSRSISWVVNDGVANSTAQTSSLTLVHAAPVVVAGASVTYETGSIAPVALDAGLTVTDADSNGDLTSATVQIGTGFVANADVLTFTAHSGSNSSYISATGQVSLTTTTPHSIAACQAELDSVAYSTPSTPTPARAIPWTVNDGSGSHPTHSPAATSTVNVEIGPHITAGATVAFSGGSATPVALDSALKLTDASSTKLSGATISIGSFVSGDTLNFVNQNNITGQYDAVHGILTLTGQDNLTDYTAALDSITYSFTPANGDASGGGAQTSRSISWTVTDGTANSNTATSTLNTSRTAPVVTAGATVNYEIGGTAAVKLDGALIVTDSDSAGNLSSAKVSIGTGFAANADTLNFTNQNGISGSYAAATGILTLTTTTPQSVGAFQTALESITFSTTGTSTTARTISWSVNDGTSGAAGTNLTATSTVDLQAGPHVTAGASVNFTGGGSSVVLDPGLTLTDGFGTTLNQATVSIASGGVSGDILTINGALVGDINNGANGTIHYQSTGATLTLSGTDTVADYQAALELVNFPNTANGDPTGAALISRSRGINWTVTDGNASSTATSTLTTVHTAPVVTAGAAISYEIGSTAPVTLDGGLTVSDVDSGGNLTGATVTIGAGFAAANDSLSIGGATTGDINNGVNGTIHYALSGATLTLSGTDTVTDYQAALDAVAFSTSATGTGARTISWSVTDGSVAHGTNAAATSTVSVLAGPQVISGGTVNFTGGGSAVALDPTLTLADPFSTTLANATVTIASGNVTGDTLTINGTSVGDINDGGNGLRFITSSPARH